MNFDATKSNATRLLGMVLAWAAGRYHLSSDQVALIMSDAGYVGAAVTFAYGMFEHWNMKKVPDNSTAVQLPASVTVPPVGQSINLAPATGLAKVVGVLLIGFILLSVAPAHAAPLPIPKPKPTISQVQSNPLLLLQQFSVSDLNAAIADAQSQIPPDTVAVACYQAVLTVVQSPASNPLPAGVGVFQGIQKARDAKALIANLQSPTGPLATINNACAPLILDAQNTLVMLGVGAGLVSNPLGATAALAGLPAVIASFLALPKL